MDNINCIAIDTISGLSVYSVFFSPVICWPSCKTVNVSATSFERCGFMLQIPALSKASVRIGDPQKVDQILNDMRKAGPNTVQVS